MKTAIEQMARLNLRRSRAESLAATILREIEHLIPGENQREAYYRIFDMMDKNGFAWTNDEERDRMGLEPRDEFGWTPSERQKDEMWKQEALMAMANRVYQAQDLSAHIEEG